MPRGPAWLQGIPEKPYVRTTSYVGQDVLVQLTFLNSAAVPTQPTAIKYEVDSLETATNVIPSTVVAPTGSTQTIQLPGAQMQTTRPQFGRENMQMWITAVIPDTNASSGSITVQELVIIELINVMIPPY
jgi:hypothetical protein